MERYKNKKQNALKELEKEEAEVEKMRAKRKKENQQLRIMIGDIPRVQAEEEKALRAIHELQLRIDNNKTSCSEGITEKMQAVESIDQEIEKQLSIKEQLEDAVSKLKEEIADLNVSTTRKVTHIENSTKSFEDATITHEKNVAKCLRKSKKVEAKIEKTKLDLRTRDIENEFYERGAVIVEDARKRENEYIDKTFYNPDNFGNESDYSE
ncbi:predicted protein [Chaetoceros tenuissimus]|uniref:Uncharacterized protein n=1 Tax=Chaetoceros tenuissimus TaxID=426638 RepID=A0AAD3CYF1_9STRA|nr:predicted protein [Chaetoceros tenuissimus]